MGLYPVVAWAVRGNVPIKVIGEERLTAEPSPKQCREHCPSARRFGRSDLARVSAVRIPFIGCRVYGEVSRERWDLQRWIEDYPEIVGPDLLVVTTEFDRWELGSDRVRDRLDVLFLDSTGSLVVAELKRGEAPDIPPRHAS